MAWDGTVRRRVIAVDCNGPVLHLECGHREAWPMPGARPIAVYGSLLSGGEWVCDECSGPHRARIREIQRGISFDGVLKKLRGLRPENG